MINKEQNPERQRLVQAVFDANAKLAFAQIDLIHFDESIENNVYESKEEAEDYLTEELLERARKDCEGSYNCGHEQYTQDFIVNGYPYRATLEVEYNRHDKTYYYVDEYEMSIEEL
jgi:hypothetical protein